jgi:hypothetical protein
MIQHVMGFWDDDRRYHDLNKISSDAVIGLFYLAAGTHAIWSDDHNDYVGVDWLEKQKSPVA